MLLDSAAQLNALHQQLQSFLSSDATSIDVEAQTSASPAPYDAFLKGLRVRKTQDGVLLRLGEDGWLELSGAPAHLGRYISHFRFAHPQKSAHHHPDHGDYMAAGTLCLVIEADPYWSALRDD
ncbi:MAG: hypothetical protein Q4G39_10165 [Brachymonas sp.]|nr:hypothetical protein [Brachymonas sp.]